MRSVEALVAAAAFMLAALAVGASSAQAPASPAAQAPAGGRAGGGRGGPGATLYAEHCVSCHGTDLAGGRYDSLFDQTWLAKMTDERMMSSIQNGVPNTEMEGFKQALTEIQVWQLIQYIRTQGGSLAPKPQFVADPNGHLHHRSKDDLCIKQEWSKNNQRSRTSFHQANRPVSGTSNLLFRISFPANTRLHLHLINKHVVRLCMPLNVFHRSF